MKNNTVKTVNSKRAKQQRILPGLRNYTVSVNTVVPIDERYPAKKQYFEYKARNTKPIFLMLL